MRRGLRRRASPGAGRRLRPGADLHARQQQDPRPSSTTRSNGAWATSWSTRSTRSTASWRARAARAHARHAGNQGQHPLLHPDRPGRLEVRLPARRRAASGRALRRGGARAARAPRAHRLADLRPRGVRGGGRGARAGWASGRCSTSAAASASPTPRRTSRRAIEDYAEALLRHVPPGVKVLCEPGRSLVGNAGVTALHGGHRQTDARRADLGRRGRRHVRQPAADALRRPLRGGDRGPLRRGGAVHGRRHALRVRRRARARRARSTTPARATCS